MKHYLLLKLNQSTSLPEFADSAQVILSELVSAGIGIKAVRVYQNTVDRPDNMDIMVVFDMQDTAALKAYITHPAHIRFIEYAKPKILKKISFDRTV